MSLNARIRWAASARGIRRGCSLANSAGTYEFAREHPATSRALAVDASRAAGRRAACERARKFRRRERAGLPGAMRARLRMRSAGGAV
jgi:hypothetical protein